MKVLTILIFAVIATKLVYTVSQEYKHIRKENNLFIVVTIVFSVLMAIALIGCFYLIYLLPI